MEKGKNFKKANKFFSKECIFILGAAEDVQFPESNICEIAFAGRSNVGKSSLINALTNRKNLARTSNTPGRTQQINFFDLDKKFIIADLPGYGFAKAPKNMVNKWNRLVFSYLRERGNLRRVFLLIDARHGIKKNDEEVMSMLDIAAVNYQIILTKIDKINDLKLKEVMDNTKEKMIKHPASYPYIVKTSSQLNIGIEELRAEIIDIV